MRPGNCLNPKPGRSKISAARESLQAHLRQKDGERERARERASERERERERESQTPTGTDAHVGVLEFREGRNHLFPKGMQ